MDKHLYCGAAKRSIAPPAELLPDLFCVMPRTRFQTIEDGLYVRAIALRSGEDTLLFVAYELDQAPFPHKSMEVLSGKYGIPEENMFFLGNHSHEVPVTGIRAAEPEHNQQRESPAHYEATTAYENLVMQAMYEAVDEALGSLRPARLGWGEGESLINTHRDMLCPAILPVDRTLFTLRVEGLDGQPIAFLLNYSAHNSCVKLDYVVSADLEGCVSHLMEDHFPGAVAVWSLSAHGDLMPRADYWNVPVSVKAPDFAVPEKTDVPCFRRMRVLALRQFEDALRILSSVQCRELPDAAVASAVDYVEIPACPNGDESGVPEPLRLRLHLVRLGGLVFVGNGGKLYNGYKMLIRSMLPLELQSVVLSQDTCETSTITYVWDDRALMERRARGQSVPVRPGSTAAGIRETMRRLMEKTGIPAVDEPGT